MNLRDICYKIFIIKVLQNDLIFSRFQKNKSQIKSQFLKMISNQHNSWENDLKSYFLIFKSYKTLLKFICFLGMME